MDRRAFFSSGVAGLAAGSLLNPARSAQWLVRDRVAPDRFSDVPALSDEAMGWLAHVHRKTLLPGTWRKDETVQEAWDTRSFRPTMYYPRYELTWLTWGMGLMAETTPAWREGYATVLGYASKRFMEYHALNEWIEQRGPDPDRKKYPAAMEPLLPNGLKGKYDLPGWAANGRAPFTYDPDPLRGAGHFNLMYKGYMNYVHSMYRHVSGDASLDQGYTVTYDDTMSWRTSQRELNALLASQWKSHEAGIACEVVKIYPWCNALSGAGVQLYDRMANTSYSRDFLPWLDYLRTHLVTFDTNHRAVNLVGYYDDEIHGGLVDPRMQSGANWMVTMWTGLPTDSNTFEELYDGAMELLYRRQPDGSAAIRGGTHTEAASDIATGVGAALAAELGDTRRQSALRAYLDAKCSPTWDRERAEFFYTFGINEPWPRGQMNAWVMPSRLVHRTGMWRELFQAPDARRHTEPTLSGVDFPRLRVRQAWYDRSARTLRIALATPFAELAGRATSVTISNLAPMARYAVRLDGTVTEYSTDTRARIELPVTYGAHTIEIAPA
jgi:Linalool dehydratase/isomerase